MRSNLFFFFRQMSESSPSDTIAVSNIPPPSGEEWSTQKSKPRPAVRKRGIPTPEGVPIPVEKSEENAPKTEDSTEVSGKREIPLGIEKQKRFTMGYLKVKIRMLEANQLLLWFKTLQQSAKTEHWNRTGERDDTFTQAKIEI